MSDSGFPLFPLHAVLFPGGRLRLRLFEPRYLDLVKRCSRNGSSFGVCLILHGEEAGAPATPAVVGTEAAIVDFAMTDDGLLGITVEGRRRFQVRQARAQHDGLLLGEVDWLDESPTALAPEHGLLAQLLERILERARVADDGQRQQQLQRADWVGWRLAEWLPLENQERQALLAEADPTKRLQALLRRLPDFQDD